METAELIWEENGKSANGFPKKKRHVTIVYARELSVARAEKYESMRAGVSVKTVLEIRQEDWEETRHMVSGKPEYARKAIYDGVEYEIVRTYKKGKSTIEVVCG